jgi:hypothetical protein
LGNHVIIISTILIGTQSKTRRGGVERRPVGKHGLRTCRPSARLICYTGLAGCIGKLERVASNSKNTVSFWYHTGQSGSRPIDHFCTRGRQLTYRFNFSRLQLLNCIEPERIALRNASTPISGKRGHIPEGRNVGASPVICFQDVHSRFLVQFAVSSRWQWLR